MTIDWQMEADRANRLYAQASRRIERLEAALREIAFDDIAGASIQHKEIARTALAKSSPPKAIEREGYPKDGFINDYD